MPSLPLPFPLSTTMSPGYLPSSNVSRHYRRNAEGTTKICQQVSRGPVIRATAARLVQKPFRLLFEARSADDRRIRYVVMESIRVETAAKRPWCVRTTPSRRKKVRKGAEPRSSRSCGRLRSTPSWPSGCKTDCRAWISHPCLPPSPGRQGCSART